MNLFNRTLTFDFGSSNTVVCENGRVVYDEPTEIAILNDSVVKVGIKARAFYSCKCERIKPIVSGHVDNHEAFEAYVKGVLRKIIWFPQICLNSVLIAVPNDMNEGDNAALCEPFRKRGVKNIMIIPRGVASCLGNYGIVPTKCEQML